MIKLGVFDLDKTLLDGNSRLPRDFYENVEILRKRGVTVAIASGRPAESLLYLFHKATDDMLICGEDGNLEKRFVTVGKSLWGSYTEILDGITAEDFLAFPYGNDVKPGAPAVEAEISALYE